MDATLSIGITWHKTCFQVDPQKSHFHHLLGLWTDGRRLQVAILYKENAFENKKKERVIEARGQQDTTSGMPVVVLLFGRRWSELSSVGYLINSHAPDSELLLESVTPTP